MSATLGSSGPLQNRAATNTKGFSCLTCRQRKIKCDRLDPCSNCSKGGRQCSFIPPVRGKPKPRKAVKEGLHSKLRRYEEMLKAYGAMIEPSQDGNNVSDGETISEPDYDMIKDEASSSRNESGGPAFDENKSRLVNKNGSSRYFDT